MEFIQQISGIIILITTTMGAVLAVIEKSQSIKWRPLSKLFGLDSLSNEVNAIRTDIETIKISQSDIKNSISEIKTEQVAIKKEQSIMKAEQKDTSLDNYRAEIMQFASMLKNDYVPDSIEFQHIHNVYDKYIAKGGNSYIHGVMDYIVNIERLYLNK